MSKFRAMPVKTRALLVCVAMLGALLMAGAAKMFVVVSAMSGLVDDTNKIHQAQHIKFGANVDHSTTTIHGGHSLVVDNDSLGGFESGADKTFSDALAHSSTDKAICRFSGTSGGTQNSLVSVSDTGKISGVADATASTDVPAFHQIADTILAGRSTACDAITTSNQASLTGTAQTVDGVALSSAGMRACVFGQTTVTQDGCYVVASGAWTRCTDLPVGANASNRYFVTVAGTSNKGVWAVQAGANIVGTNDLVVANQATGGGGGGTIGGTLGAVANVVPMSSGTGGVTLQASPLVITGTVASGITFADPTAAQQPVTLNSLQNARNPANFFAINEEFAGSLLANLTASATIPGPGGMVTTLSGTGAQFNLIANTATEYGIRQLKPGTTTTGQANYFNSDGSNGSITFTSANANYFSNRSLVEQLSNGTDTYTLNIGFFNAVSAAPTEAIVFRHSNGVANWQFITTTGGVSTTTDTTIPVVAGTAFTTSGVGCKFEVSKAAAVSALTWTVTCTGVTAATGTVSTNIPSGALLTGATMISSAGTGSGRAMRSDWHYVRIDFATPRG